MVFLVPSVYLLILWFYFSATNIPRVNRHVIFSFRSPFLQMSKSRALKTTWLHLVLYSPTGIASLRLSHSMGTWDTGIHRKRHLDWNEAFFFAGTILTAVSCLCDEVNYRLYWKFAQHSTLSSQERTLGNVLTSDSLWSSIFSFLSKFQKAGNTWHSISSVYSCQSHEYSPSKDSHF